MRPLPKIEPGDYVIIHDAGEITLASWWERQSLDDMLAVIS